jgi:hypothetical protein
VGAAEVSRKKLSPSEEEFERNLPFLEAQLFAKRIPPGSPEPQQHDPHCDLFKIGLPRVPTCTCGLEQPK